MPRPLRFASLLSVALLVSAPPAAHAQSAAATPMLLWSRGHATDGRLGDGRLVAVPTAVAANVVALAAGEGHTLYVDSSGTLWAAGLNHRGQLGTGTGAFTESLAQRVAENVAKVAAGEHHSLFLKTDGTLWGMGDNADGQLGDGTTVSRFRPVAIANDVVAIGAGDSHSLFVRADGTLWGMGRNSSGQLEARSAQPRVVPVQMTSDVRVAIGGPDFSLFIKTNGTLWAVGAGPWMSGGSSIPVQIAPSATAIAAGRDYLLFLRADATLWGLGHNTDGSLGDGTERTATTPVQIARGIIAVDAGYRHSLFLASDGTLWGTGRNVYGQLGDGTLTRRLAPVPIASGVKAMAAGDEFTLYTRSDGTLMSVGLNAYGQLAAGFTDDRLTPLLVAPRVTKISTSLRSTGHTLFLDDNRGLWAMGDNSAGQLADGTTTSRMSPVRVADDIIDVAAGGGHTLIVRADGTLWAVGANFAGQLGDGSGNLQRSPVQVARDVVAVAAGERHSLYIDRQGSVWFMGHYGVSITTDGRISTPTPVRMRFGGAVAVAAGTTHSLFLDADGTLWGFGSNSLGQIGLVGSFNTGWTVPRVMAENVRSMAAGPARSFFIKTDGTLWGMGANGWGDLGDGTTVNRDRPVQAATNVRAVAAGDFHTLFVRNDGTLWATGYVGDGGFGGAGEVLQLGTPIQVATGVAGVAAGSGVSYQLTQPGTGVAPVIVTHPAATEFVIGSRVILDVAATGGTPLDFRWRKDGVDLPAARSQRLIIPCALREHAGLYDVVVTNSSGTVTSARVAVSVHVATITSAPPPALALAPGGDLVLTVAATARGPLTYQWKKDGQDIPGAAGPRLQIANVQPAHAGAYTVTITSAEGSMTLPATVVELTGTRISNLSVRTYAGQDDQMLIVGFAIGGRRAQTGGRLLVRGVGPSLATFGIADFLPDPSITVFHGTNAIARNDDWSGAPDLANAAGSVGAFAFTGPGSRDAALITSPAADSYTVQVGATTAVPGNTLVEIYDLNATGPAGATAPQLVNVSARARAGGGSGPLIAGFVITGTGRKNVLIRATGPALMAFGLSDALADPRLELFRAGVAGAVASNDNWSGSPTLAAAFSQVGAFALDPQSRDAALLIELQPGAYTAEINGVNNASGIALIEVYDLDP